MKGMERGDQAAREEDGREQGQQVSRHLKKDAVDLKLIIRLNDGTCEFHYALRLYFCMLEILHSGKFF